MLNHQSALEVRSGPDGGSRWMKVRLSAAAPLLILTLLAATVQMAAAQEGTIVRCEPEWVWAAWDGQAAICIYIQDIPEGIGLYGLYFEMEFPLMVGLATVVDENPFTPDEVEITPRVPAGWAPFLNAADNLAGSLTYATYGKDPAPAIVESGSVACMRFQGISKAGTFEMEFTTHELADDAGGGDVPNTAHDCHVTFVGPTSVDLLGFEAWPEGRELHIQWETANEIDNMGFNLYRSTSSEGKRTKLNDVLIATLAPPGSPFGAAYEYIDEHIRDRQPYFYWLEDVDIYGHATLHGPVTGTRDMRRL